MSGSYSGSVSDSISGVGTITLDVQQQKKRITGIWGTSYPNGTGASGTLSGTVSKSAITAKLATRYAHCFYKVVVAIQFDTFRGTYIDTKKCPGDDSGSFVIPRSSQ